MNKTKDINKTTNKIIPQAKTMPQAFITPEAHMGG